MKLKKGNLEKKMDIEGYKSSLSKSMGKFKEINEDGKNHAKAVEKISEMVSLVEVDEEMDRTTQMNLLKNLKEMTLEIQHSYNENIEKVEKEIEQDIKEQLGEVDEQVQLIDEKSKEMENVKGEGNVEQIVNVGRQKAQAGLKERKNAYAAVSEFNKAVVQSQINEFRRHMNVVKGQYGKENKYN